ncbi:hypothetical protein AOLI_G00091410 [Acnodon oligacanthus]
MTLTFEKELFAKADGNYSDCQMNQFSTLHASFGPYVAFRGENRVLHAVKPEAAAAAAAAASSSSVHFYKSPAYCLVSMSDERVENMVGEALCLTFLPPGYEGDGEPDPQAAP